MFKAIRITVLLLFLIVIALGNWLTKSRSTDWNNSLWIALYPINGDGSGESDRYIRSLTVEQFSAIEEFIAREAVRYGHELDRPVRVELGTEVGEQPPDMAPSPGIVRIMLWSLRMRWWAARIIRDQDGVSPDVGIFVRYHTPQTELALENSVGLQKGMVGIVNAFAGHHYAEINNVIIAHEFLHTLGATDKYDPASGLPEYPAGYAEPRREPLLPQRRAEIMGGRIAVSESEAMIPRSLRHVVIGPETATEIRLTP